MGTVLTNFKFSILTLQDNQKFGQEYSWYLFYWYRCLNFQFIDPLSWSCRIINQINVIICIKNMIDGARLLRIIGKIWISSFYKATFLISNRPNYTIFRRLLKNFNWVYGINWEHIQSQFLPSRGSQSPNVPLQGKTCKICF